VVEKPYVFHLSVVSTKIHQFSEFFTHCTVYRVNCVSNIRAFGQRLYSCSKVRVIFFPVLNHHSAPHVIVH